MEYPIDAGKLFEGVVAVCASTNGYNDRLGVTLLYGDDAEVNTQNKAFYDRAVAVLSGKEEL